jgi:hypothetical protein
MFSQKSEILSDWKFQYLMMVYVIKTILLLHSLLRTLLRLIWTCFVILQRLQGICTLHIVGVAASETLLF